MSGERDGVACSEEHFQHQINPAGLIDNHPKGDLGTSMMKNSSGIPYSYISFGKGLASDIIKYKQNKNKVKEQPFGNRKTFIDRSMPNESRSTLGLMEIPRKTARMREILHAEMHLFFTKI